MAEKETKIGRRNTIEELGKLGESDQKPNGLAQQAGLWNDIRRFNSIHGEADR